MNNAGNSTHKARAVNPKVFRAAATGIGQQFSASARTGMARAQQAINCAPEAQRRVADPSYPAPNEAPTGDYLPVESPESLRIHRGTVSMNPTMSPVQLKRAGR
jgi:hypothetical protein